MNFVINPTIEPVGTKYWGFFTYLDPFHPNVNNTLGEYMLISARYNSYQVSSHHCTSVSVNTSHNLLPAYDANDKSHAKSCYFMLTRVGVKGNPSKDKTNMFSGNTVSLDDPMQSYSAISKISIFNTKEQAITAYNKVIEELITLKKEVLSDVENEILKLKGLIFQ